MTLVAIVCFVSVLASIGWFWVGVVEHDLGKIERAGLAYGVGAGVFSLGVFLGSLLRLPINLLTGALVALVLMSGGAWLLARRRRVNTIIPKPIDSPGWSFFELEIVGAIGFIIILAFVLAIRWQPYTWDALSAWLLKGRLIAASGSLELVGLSDAPSYPLNISIQTAFIYMIDAKFVQVIFPAYLLSLILVFYARLREMANRAIALVCALLLAATPFLLSLATIGYANIPFAFYYVVSALYLYQFLRERKPSWLILSALLLGLAGWTRSEAPVYFAINIVVLVVFLRFTRETIKPLSVYGAIVLILWLPWNIYWRAAGLGDFLAGGFDVFKEIALNRWDVQRILDISSFFFSSALAFRTWSLLWIAFPIALIVGWRQRRAFAPLIALIVLNSFALIFFYYAAGSNAQLTIHRWLETGFDRMALHFGPLILFLFGLALEEFQPLEEFMQHPRINIDRYLILLLFFSLFAIVPLLAPGYFWGAHDGRHSVYFLFEFDRSIQDGILYPRWAPDYTFGYGYPMFNIYAPGALYASEAFHLLGFDFVTATKIVFALAIVLSGVAMFALIKRLTSSRQAAFLSGVAYVYITYHIADVYVRAALAESVALIFLPLTLWGFYETVVTPSRVTIVAAACAYAAMMFSHNGVAMLFTIVLGVWVLFLMFGELRSQSPTTNHRSPISHLSSLISSGMPSLAAFLLGLGLVAIFFVPAVLEYQYVRTDQWLDKYYDYTNHFAYFYQLFSPTWGFGISNPGPRDDMSFQLGVVPVLLAAFSIVALERNPRNTRRWWVFFLTMGVVVAALMLSFSLPLWETLRPILSFAQFPWRLLTLMMVPLAALAGAIILADDSENTTPYLSLPTILLGLLIISGSFPYLTAQMILEPKEGPVSILGLFRFQQSAGEMTGSTAWVKEIPDWSPMADVYFAGKKLKSKIDYTHIDADKVWIGVLPNFSGFRANGEQIVYHAQEDSTISFNTFYYPGWRAYLTKPKTTEIVRELPIDVDPDDPLGRIRVHIPQGQEQWLLLRFDDTLPRIVGNWVSAGSILLALGLVIWEVRDRRRSEGRRQKREK